ncbi:hypothetical protein BJ165DRAFT_343425 [Panaeolus papilionaceus]|nr:hypothetical protein BJ165DRAFT_343425 [Panaeolus papilionaceus]
MPAHDQHMLLEDSLQSARVLSREFSQYNREFGNALTQFELQKPSLLVPHPRESCPSESTYSTTNAVDSLFSSLHSMQTYLDEIIAFWDDHAEMLSNDINPSPSSNRNRLSPDNHDLAETWLGYQRALLDASSSIAESVDAMAVEPAIHPQPNLHRVHSVAQEERGILNTLQWFWRRITFTNSRVR